MPEEYVIAAAEYHGQRVSKLICTSELSEGATPEDFFTAGHTNIREVGRIQVVGDTHELEFVYAAEL